MSGIFDLLVQLGVNMYPVIQPAAQLLKVLRPARITDYGFLPRNTSCTRNKPQRYRAS